MAKKSLLIVDQDTYWAHVFADRFERAGWKVWMEENVVAGKKRLKRCAPDVVIVDLDPMDEVLTFLEELQHEPKTVKTLQIGLTRLGDRKTMKEALTHGVDHYLLKGDFVPSDAVQKVKRFLAEKTSV